VVILVQKLVTIQAMSGLEFECERCSSEMFQMEHGIEWKYNGVASAIQDIFWSMFLCPLLVKIFYHSIKLIF